MKNFKDQKGNHTWDVSLSYHRCPACALIIENRDEYSYQLGNHVKKIECPFCDHSFKLKAISKKQVGPIFGKAHPVGMEWENE